MGLELVPSQGGNLKLWQPPVHARNYILGVDVAEGKEPSSRFGRGGRTRLHDMRDYSCAVVIDRLSAQFCAMWHGYVDTTQMSHIVQNLAMFYNEALLAIEVTGPGSAVQANLQDWGYTNFYAPLHENKLEIKLKGFFGWKTSPQTRPRLISAIHEMLEEDWCDIPSDELLAEMRTMQFDKNGQERGLGIHKDDRVMAYGIALRVRMDDLMTSMAPQASDKYAHLSPMDRRIWEQNDRLEEMRTNERGQDGFDD